MKIQKILLSLFFIPGISYADISFELNELFKDIFSNKKIEQEKTEQKIPEISIPKNVSENDKNKLEESIKDQERALKNFETKVLDLEAEIYELEEQNSELSEQLIGVDEELSSLSQSFSTIAAQEEKWYQELITETKALAELRIKIRIEKKDLNKDLNKKFIQSKVFGSNEETSIIQWIFSDKKVSEILSQKKQARKKQHQQFLRLQRLKSLETELALREKKSAQFYQKFSGLKKSLETQRQALLALSNNKAEILQTLTSQKVVRERSLNTYKEKEEEAYLFLVGLQKSQEKINQMEVIEPEKEEDSFFSSMKDLLISSKKPAEWISPLKKPLVVTANFLDPVYENEFGKPHFGTDFESPQGSDIFAPQNGVVIRAKNNGFDYSYLVLDHGENLYTLYGHLSEILVQEGDEISQGGLIAKTGGTPGTEGAGYFTTGPHLHMEVFKDDQHVNPIDYLSDFVVE